MSNPMLRRSIRALCLSVLCTAALSAAAAPPMYRVKVAVPPTGDGIFWYWGLALNNDGKILVHTYQLGNPYSGYEVFDKDGRWLKGLGGDSKYGGASYSAINNFGDVVGSATHVWGVWHGTVVKDQGFGATIYGFPDDEWGGYYSDAHAYGLSDSGHVAGWATGSRDGRHRAFVAGPDGKQELGTFGGATSDAYDVNNQGTAIGVADLADGSRHAFISRHGLLKDLGTFGGPSSVANDINNAGQVVGSAQLADGSSRAFLFQKGQMTAIPTPEGAKSDAWAINHHGLVLGSYRVDGVGTPYLYDGTGVYKVDDLLSDADKAVWTITSVGALNDKGWLLANGHKAGDKHDSVLLLKPVKTPAAETATAR